MEKFEYKSQSKRLLDLMVNSIYTHKEIFLRELISNASDAIDARYFRSLTLDNSGAEHKITLAVDSEKRTLTIADSGIGMSKEDMIENLGTIAKSGTLEYKQNAPKQGDEQSDSATATADMIGQFGVGFYSAFMVAERIVVESTEAESGKAWRWTSEGSDGYAVDEITRDSVGTSVTLYLRDDSVDSSEDGASDSSLNYSQYLAPHRLRQLVKRYSDFIRYPIVLLGTDEDGTLTEETLNSMVPIWRKNKSELSAEDYESFYMDKGLGYEKPLSHFHISSDGLISYNAVLYIPSRPPYEFYTKDFRKGPALYSNGVMIMEHCPDLLPEYFSFVQGIVDCADLSLNISRELLQHDRQLSRIAKHIKDRIKRELSVLLTKRRDDYETFFDGFGRALKFGVYSGFGEETELLADLLLFRSSNGDKPVTLSEYVERMGESQDSIYYITASSAEIAAKLPKTEGMLSRGIEVLYLTEDVDEFAVKMMNVYKQGEKEYKFVSLTSGDFSMPQDSEKEPDEVKPQDEELFTLMKEILGDKVEAVRASTGLVSHASCVVSEGEISLEMERVLSAIPGSEGVKAKRILEINRSHSVFNKLVAVKDDSEKLGAFARVLLTQALMMEGVEPEDPVAYSQDVWEIVS